VADAADPEAVVTVSGATRLVAGVNQLQVTVQAADGSIRVYRVTLQVPAIPSVPTGLVSSNVTSSGFQLNWVAPGVSGASPVSNYTVEVSRTNGVSWVSVRSSVSTSTRVTVSGAAPGTTYLIRIAAINASGASSYLTGSVTTVATVSSAPKSLEASNLTETGVSLGWSLPDTNGGAGISDYQIEVTSNSVNGWTVIPHAAFNTRSFNVSGLLPGRTYQFRVSAVNAVGVGVPSGVVTVTTLGGVKPVAPGELTYSLIGVSRVTLAWPKVVATQRVSNYVLDVSLDGIIWISVAKKVSPLSIIALSGLRAGRTYQVRVAAVNAIGQGPYRLGSFTTLADVSTAPRNLIFSDVTSTSFSVNWLAPASDGGAAITDYVVDIKDGSSGWVTVVRPVSSQTSATVTGLNPGVRYAVRVKAVNQMGVSGSSAAFKVVTLASAPSAPIVTLNTLTSSTASMSWVVESDGRSKITNYLVEYSTNNGVSWLNLPKNVSNSRIITLRGLKPQTKYLFKVSAVNSVGQSPASELLEVTTQ
jgi:titin